MKQGIHPDYKKVTATCSCGATFEVGTTVGHDLSLDVCSQCHPFYTGKQKQATPGGRVERFNKRFGAAIQRGCSGSPPGDARSARKPAVTAGFLLPVVCREGSIRYRLWLPWEL